MWDKKEMFQPNECLLREVSTNKRQTFGIPKENQNLETRLALTPEAVALLVEEGHRVLVESGAGNGIHYSDLRYSECGAKIVNSPAEVFSADIVLKITPPTPNEILLMREKATLGSMLQLSLFSPQSIKLMMQKKITAIAYELIKDEQRNFPVMSSISEIDGITAISIAAQYMSNESGGKGLLLGGIAGISSAEVLVLGAGIAGATAARTALALGAQVKVFDHDINKLRKFQQQYGQHIFTSVIHPRVLFKALASADVVVGTLKYINGSERFMVAEEWINNNLPENKPDSIISFSPEDKSSPSGIDSISFGHRFIHQIEVEARQGYIIPTKSFFREENGIPRFYHI